MRLEGKIAMVTGAARGLGKEIALKLARDGADVAVTDIDLEGIQVTSKEIKELGKRSLAIKLDISDYEQVISTFEKVKDELGLINILVNNAAITTNMATITKIEKSAWDREVSVNLSGAFYCIKQVFPSMVEQKWGRIINISSAAGVMGGFGQAGYASCKAGLIGLTKTVALEGGKSGVTANAIAPGLITTDAYYGIPEKMRERIERLIPLGYAAKPSNIADIVAFLASDESQYMTGAVLMATGGMDLFTF